MHLTLDLRMTDLPTVPDEDLVLGTRFAAGDELAFASLVRRYQQLAWTVAWRVTGREDLAHDVVQEAFLRCLRHRERFHAGSPFKPWLLQIVRNLGIDALRLHRRLEPTTEALDRGVIDDPGQASQAQDLRAQVAEVLATMPEKYREILVMREMEGQAAEDIARAIGVDYGTTRWRLHEARRRFREAWVTRFGELDHA